MYIHICRDVSSIHFHVYSVAFFSYSKTTRKRKSKVLLIEDFGASGSGFNLCTL